MSVFKDHTFPAPTASVRPCSSQSLVSLGRANSRWTVQRRRRRAALLEASVLWAGSSRPSCIGQPRPELQLLSSSRASAASVQVGLNWNIHQLTMARIILRSAEPVAVETSVGLCGPGQWPVSWELKWTAGCAPGVASAAKRRKHIKSFWNETRSSEAVSVVRQSHRCNKSALS